MDVLDFTDYNGRDLKVDVNTLEGVERIEDERENSESSIKFKDVSDLERHLKEYGYEDAYGKETIDHIMHKVWTWRGGDQDE